MRSLARRTQTVNRIVNIRHSASGASVAVPAGGGTSVEMMRLTQTVLREG